MGSVGYETPSVLSRDLFRDRLRMSDPPLSRAQAVAKNAGAAAPPPDQKPAMDVVAGATARAASQATIHPIDTMKVRMQAGDMSAGGECRAA